MDLWLCHEEMDQCCYFGVLPMTMNDSIYKSIAGKAYDHDSNDMKTEEKVDWFASWLICIHESVNYVMWI
jgi:hypothetical protein